MLSRSKRIFGIAALTLAAATATAAPAYADENFVTDLGILRELQAPLCLPGTTTGIAIVDALLPQLMACAQAKIAG
ncbi:hypothetical protein GCM10022224_091690 [Nonomuraea antimicrobica]|uniref:Uncharacterized protein n=1 Tax=Nonomuraea antimicrobica TaxID=561173 RepID=A0ABP7DZE2_9ACTN